MADARGFVATVKAFNEAVDQTKAFNPNVKDGRRTNGLAVDADGAVMLGLFACGELESAPPVAFGLPAQWGGSEVRISGPAAD
jgi:hypothetical protein